MKIVLLFVFGITLWLISMKQKPFYPNMMNLLVLSIMTSPSVEEVERGFSLIKLLCTRLRARMLPSKLDILMQICLCGDSLTDGAFEKVVDIYRDSAVDENEVGSQTKRRTISL